jgi:hypothetical protein
VPGASSPVALGNLGGRGPSAPRHQRNELPVFQLEHVFSLAEGAHADEARTRLEQRSPAQTHGPHVEHRAALVTQPVHVPCLFEQSVELLAVGMRNAIPHPAVIGRLSLTLRSARKHST